MFSMPRPVSSLFQTPPVHGHHQRRRKYIDARLQGRLLAALVILEVSLLCAAMLYLYVQFSQVIDANIYTVHRSAQQPLLPVFLQQMGVVIVSMAIINTLALLFANRIWTIHVHRVLVAFRYRLGRIATLNLCAVDDQVAGHEVLALLEQLRQRESQRVAKMDELQQGLEHAIETGVSAATVMHLAGELEATLQDVR